MPISCALLQNSSVSSRTCTTFHGFERLRFDPHKNDSARSRSDSGTRILNFTCLAGNSNDRFSTLETGIGTTMRSSRDDEISSRTTVGHKHCFWCSSKERRSKTGVDSDSCKVHQSEKLIIRFRNDIFDDSSSSHCSTIDKDMLGVKAYPKGGKWYPWWGVIEKGLCVFNIQYN